MKNCRQSCRPPWNTKTWRSAASRSHTRRSWTAKAVRRCGGVKSRNGRLHWAWGKREHTLANNTPWLVGISVTTNNLGSQRECWINRRWPKDPSAAGKWALRCWRCSVANVTVASSLARWRVWAIKWPGGGFRQRESRDKITWLCLNYHTDIRTLNRSMVTWLYSNHVTTKSHHLSPVFSK